MILIIKKIKLKRKKGIKKLEKKNLKNIKEIQGNLQCENLKVELLVLNNFVFIYYLFN